MKSLYESALPCDFNTLHERVTRIDLEGLKMIFLHSSALEGHRRVIEGSATQHVFYYTEALPSRRLKSSGSAKYLLFVVRKTFSLKDEKGLSKDTKWRALGAL